MALTPRQERFVQEYLVDLNATQACIRAGYSKRNATKIGPELLGKTGVQAAIQRLMAIRAERTNITQDDVIRELIVMVTSDVTNYTLDANGELALAAGVPESAWRAVSSVKHKIRSTKHRDGTVDTQHDVEFKLWDKVGASRLAAQHLGMLLEKIEHSGKIEGDLSGKTREELEELADAYRQRRAARQSESGD